MQRESNAQVKQMQAMLGKCLNEISELKRRVGTLEDKVSKMPNTASITANPVEGIYGSMVIGEQG